jgi:hypothetical protein
MVLHEPSVFSVKEDGLLLQETMQALFWPSCALLRNGGLKAGMKIEISLCCVTELRYNAGLSVTWDYHVQCVVSVF